MPPDHESNNDKALKSVEEILKTIIATSGILLALLWGLIQRQGISARVFTTIRIASIVFVVSIFFALLGCQFIVGRLEMGSENITKHKAVAFSFLISWIAFLSGCALLILAIFGVS
jgi:hypothetical protein